MLDELTVHTAADMAVMETDSTPPFCKQVSHPIIYLRQKLTVAFLDVGSKPLYSSYNKLPLVSSRH